MGIDTIQSVCKTQALLFGLPSEPAGESMGMQQVKLTGDMFMSFTTMIMCFEILALNFNFSTSQFHGDDYLPSQKPRPFSPQNDSVTYFAIPDKHYTVDCKILRDLLHLQYSGASGAGTI